MAGCFSTNAEKNRETGETYSLDMSRVYPSYEAMAEAESRRPDGIDFVSITTPNNTHYDVAKCFLQHGIHVVCEKPLCFTVEQAQELVALAKEKTWFRRHLYLFRLHHDEGGPRDDRRGQDRQDRRRQCGVCPGVAHR